MTLVQRCAVRIAALTLTLVTATNVVTPHAFADAAASSSRAARNEAMRAIPWQQIAPQYRRAAQNVVNDASIYRRLPTRVIDCDPEVFTFLLQHPEVVIDVWRVMGISQVSLDKQPNGAYRGSDGAGTVGNVRYLLADWKQSAENTAVVYADGSYDGKPFVKPLKAQSLILLRSGSVRETNGRQYITVRIDSFVKIEQMGIELVAKSVQPWISKSADRNFIETLTFVSNFSRTAEKNPEGMKRLVTRLNAVDQPTRDELVAICFRTAERYAQRDDATRTSLDDLVHRTDPLLAEAKWIKPLVAAASARLKDESRSGAWPQLGVAMFASISHVHAKPWHGTHDEKLESIRSLTSSRTNVTNSTFLTRDFILNRILVAFAIPAALSVVALGARWWWLLDLCTHFRAHYFAALAIATLICLVARRFKLAAVFGAFAVLNFWFIAPLYFGPLTHNAQGSPLRVMTVNAYCANQKRQLLPQYIKEVSPDILLVMEVDGGWAALLEQLADTYPHRLIESRQQDCFGIALLSKLPAKRLEVQAIGPAGVPSIYAEFNNRDSSSFYLIGSHPVPPTSSHWSEMRNRQLEDLGQLVATLDGPVILLGDLNTTSWSPHFRDLLKTSGLRDSRTGFGNQPSWRSDLVSLGIAIDHVLVSPGIAVRNRNVGSNVGSDHRPVIVDLVIPSPRER